MSDLDIESGEQLEDLEHFAEEEGSAIQHQVVDLAVPSCQVSNSFDYGLYALLHHPSR